MNDSFLINIDKYRMIHLKDNGMNIIFFIYSYILIQGVSLFKKKYLNNYFMPLHCILVEKNIFISIANIIIIILIEFSFSKYNLGIIHITLTK